MTLGRAHLEFFLHFNLTLSTLCFAQTLTHFGSVIVILSPIRATEENSKLKARLEQGKEETENLVCKLNNNVFTLKFLHILCNMFRLSLFSTCLFFHWFSAERENWSTPEQVCLNCSLFVGFLVREGWVTRNWRSLCVTCQHYNCKLFFSVW